MKSLLRISIVFFSFWLVSIPLGGFSNVSQSDLKIVRLQLKWKHQFQFAGYYAAIEKGFYNEVGIDLQLLEAVEGENPSNAVFDRRADFGIATSDLVLMRANGKPVVLLASIFQHSPQVLLASKASGIRNIHELVGHEIAMEPNAADIVAYMVDEGISLEQCIIKDHSFGVDELLSGEIDAITAYATDEPFLLDKTGFEYIIINPNMGGIDFYGDVLFSTQNFIENNENLTNRFIAASLKGWDYAMKHPEEMASLIYEKYSKRHSLEHLLFEAEHMQHYLLPNIVEIGYSNPGRWKSIADVYKRLQIIDESFDINGMIYNVESRDLYPIPWLYVIGFSIIMIILFFLSFGYYKSIKKEMNNRALAEKKLKESEEKYRILFENSPDAYLIIIDGVFIECNRATEVMMGGKKELFINKTPDLLSPKYQPNGQLSSVAAAEKIAFALEHGIHTFEWVHRKINGDDLWIEVSIAVMQYEGKPALFTTWREISKRKKVEWALKESEEKYRELADFLPQLVFETDTEGALTYYNNQAYSLFGFPEGKNLIGIRTVDFHIPEDRSKVEQNIKLRIKNLPTTKKEYEMKKADGTTFPALIYSNPIIRNGETLGLRGLMIDISDRKRREEELDYKNKELERLNAEKDKFFSIIAHDLKSPFNSIMGFSSQLLESINQEENEVIEQYAKIILKSSERAMNLLMNLMEWSRSQTGRIEFSPEYFELVSLIKEASLLASDAASHKNIQLDIDGPSKVLIFADKHMMSTILRNLLSNAIKFTPNDGRIKISLKVDRKTVQISVADSGVGMSEELTKNIFKINQNISTKGTQNETGTGLGLLLCKDFVERHNGKIWVESEIEVGSVFHFSIPITSMV